MKVKSIMIVGGGSSGWMTAALLSKNVPNVNITLIESTNVPIIGVGESSLVNINRFMKPFGIPEQIWMPKCDAVYKTTIRLTDFYQKGKSFYDLTKGITPPVPMRDIKLFYNLCHQYPDLFQPFDFPEFFDDNYHMVLQNKYTDKPGPMKWNPNIEKAYHFDAYKFGLMLKDLVAIPNGVKHIIDDIYAIRTDDNGITCLETNENGPLTADLYIDCSGFRSILLEQGLKIGLIDFSEVLVNDRAIATNIPYECKKEEMVSFTDCVALDSGWEWNIPIWDRIGSGYVYSSNHTNEESAKEELRESIRKRYGSRADGLEFRSMKFTPGVRKAPWYKNVIAVGLSCAFIGPLRSTGLFLTQSMIENIARILLNTDCHVKNFDREYYNHYVIKEASEAKDWVTAQYFLSQREDSPYWKHRTNAMNHNHEGDYFSKLFRDLYDQNQSTDPEKLKMKEGNFSYHRVLAAGNYSFVTKMDHNIDMKRNPKLANELHDIKYSWLNHQAALKQYIKTLPNHYEYLRDNIYK